MIKIDAKSTLICVWFYVQMWYNFVVYLLPNPSLLVCAFEWHFDSFSCENSDQIHVISSVHLCAYLIEFWCILKASMHTKYFYKLSSNIWFKSLIQQTNWHKVKNAFVTKNSRLKCTYSHQMHAKYWPILIAMHWPQFVDSVPSESVDLEPKSSTLEIHSRKRAWKRRGFGGV